MGINIRTKGQEGEREVARALNSIIETVLIKHGHNLPSRPIIQRNQNQSAVGGSDLTNPFNLGIEVKRQEALAINTWWNQCLAACKTDGCEPMVIYRQNGKRDWTVVMYVDVPLKYMDVYSSHVTKVRAQISWNDFLQWFYTLVDRSLSLGLWVPAE